MQKQIKILAILRNFLKNFLERVQESGEREFLRPKNLKVKIYLTTICAVIKICSKSSLTEELIFFAFLAYK